MDMYDDRDVNTNTHTHNNASKAEEYARPHIKLVTCKKMTMTMVFMTMTKIY